MVIVTAMRNNLRDEIAMADEAFALSPISARAALPSEADYDAIREAFMETSRGRWFLTEYTKRNRNADTTMVLDAVARIEQTLAVQKQASADDGLARAVAAIRNSLDEARTVAAQTFDAQASSDALGPIHKGVRIIREISWRWREIGGDGRICDLLESQATAIEGAQAVLAARNETAGLDAAFGLIEATLDGLAGSPSAEAVSTESASAPVATTDMPTPASPTTLATPEPSVVTTDVVEPNATAAATAEPRVDAAGPATADDHSETAPTPAAGDEEMAHDDAVLDMIALEMGAPDFDEPEISQADIAPAITEPEDVPAPELIPEEPAARIAPEPAEIPEAAEVVLTPSLGASLLASGIVARAPSRSDPLAPIRRMTQVEKIAFFS